MSRSTDHIGLAPFRAQPTTRLDFYGARESCNSFRSQIPLSLELCKFRGEEFRSRRKLSLHPGTAHDAWGTQVTRKCGRANQQTFENLIDLQDAINAAAIK